MSKCKAITKKNKPCPIPAEEWRTSGMCHVHDPNGKFKIQQRNKGYKDNTIIGECEHKWYMRDPGIQCIKCLVIWQNQDVNL